MNDKTPRGVLQLSLLIDLGEAYLEALKQSLLEDVPHPSLDLLKSALDKATIQMRQTGQIADSHLMKIQAELEFWRTSGLSAASVSTGSKLDHVDGRVTDDFSVRRKLDS